MAAAEWDPAMLGDDPVGPSAPLSEEERLKLAADAFFGSSDVDGGHTGAGSASVVDAPAADLLNIFTDFAKLHVHRLGEMRSVLSETSSEAWEDASETVRLDMRPFDREHLGNMIHTPNSQLNKVATVFAVLVDEMKQLCATAERRFYAPLTMFGHVPQQGTASTSSTSHVAAGADGGLENTECDDTARGSGGITPPETAMGAFLPFLQDLSNFLHRCARVMRNVVNQLACLYHKRQRLYISTFKQVRLESVFTAIGEMCRMHITLDAVITDNSAIAQAWGAYTRMIKYVRAAPERYKVDPEALQRFEGLLLKLDQTVIAGRSFIRLIHADYSLPVQAAQEQPINRLKGGPNAAALELVVGNHVLAEQFNYHVKAYFKRTVAGLGEDVETYPRVRLVEVYGLYALYRGIFRGAVKPEVSLYRSLWEVQKRVPLVVLFGRALWFIPDFLLACAPLDNATRLSPKVTGITKVRTQYLHALDDTFAKRVEELYMQMCLWMVRLHSDISSEHDQSIGTILYARSILVINGVLLANSVRNLVSESVHLHLLLGDPFRASNIRPLAVCAEMLKAVEATFRSRASMLGENVAHMLGQTQFVLKRIFSPIRSQLDKFVKLDDTRLDLLAALELALELLNRSPTRERRTILRLAVSVAMFKRLVKDTHREEVRYQLWKLDLLCDWQTRVRTACDCSFLYWVTNMVPAFFSDIYNNPEQVNRLHYLFACFRDSERMLRAAPEAPLALLESYKHEVMQHFEEQIVTPLSRAVETDLRLHIHSVVLSQDNLRPSLGDGRDLARFLELQSLSFFGRTIDLRQRVTSYLDAMFYNLTTVTLHDWRIYAEMRNLAKEKFSLEMAEVHLPGSSHYSDALDVLEIMRNIHVFVARYNYNMNTQVFVERASDQKHLNTITIAHIAQSVRTHGTGIMNTTVNFTYQFLCRRFLVFSEFLFDDHIKSPLIKEVRYFRNERDALDSKYPYERAEKLRKTIARLGVSEDGTTFLDQFRALITEIGNAMGYVRAVRSAGLSHCSNAIKFIPDLGDEEKASFSEQVAQVPRAPEGGAGLSAETVVAAQNLDAVVDDLRKNVAEGTDYCRVLVEVFKNVFLGDEQKHLRAFHIIVPALTISFVEKMIVEKEKLNKKGSTAEASFTDDGFALGLAYIFRLLGLDAAFDSLHWFESALSDVAARRAMVAEQLESNSKKGKKRGGPKIVSDDVQHMQLTSNRVAALQTEFELLFFSFTGARIFFKSRELKGEDGGNDGADVAPGAAATAGDDSVRAATGGAGTFGEVPEAPPM